MGAACGPRNRCKICWGRAPVSSSGRARSSWSTSFFVHYCDKIGYKKQLQSLFLLAREGVTIRTGQAGPQELTGPKSTVRKQVGGGYTTSKPARPHLLKVPPPLQNSASDEGKAGTSGVQGQPQLYGKLEDNPEYRTPWEEKKDEEQDEEEEEEEEEMRETSFQDSLPHSEEKR